MQIFLAKTPKEERNENTFNPVIVSFAVESIEELRLLFHICNRAHLAKAIFDDYEHGLGINDCVSDINCTNIEAYRLLEKEIEDQGFEV